MLMTRRWKTDKQTFHQITSDSRIRYRKQEKQEIYLFSNSSGISKQCDGIHGDDFPEMGNRQTNIPPNHFRISNSLSEEEKKTLAVSNNSGILKQCDGIHGHDFQKTNAILFVKRGIHYDNPLLMSVREINI
ncbi:hypothetical protein CEXT_212701 [Caerostris extrusa]|uniref:Uncharacterized protein n=1 Tax=Caerostris extrusa TaxID=172846 RepID=A0AAV4QEJ9_CAEEX|nr:hypothetical protein CEXT_212701 [Caerostris extrusa]